jgi:hypothetical protein
MSKLEWFNVAIGLWGAIIIGLIVLKLYGIT